MCCVLVSGEPRRCSESQGVISVFCSLSLSVMPAPCSLDSATQAGGERQHPEDQKREDALPVAVHQRDRETLWQLHLLRLQPSGGFQRQHVAVS